MKTVVMSRDYSYRVKRSVFIQYLGGATYDRVPEAAARAIVGAGAGNVVTREADDVGSQP